MSLFVRLAAALAPYQMASTWYVGFSGGMDSQVLLQLLAEWRQRQPIPFPSVVAVHIHHGLQGVAETWPAHCAQVCAQLQIPLRVESVQVARGASLEAQARAARYAAFAKLLGPNDVLLTAQHQEDQAETLLFRLLRGAGVRGLAAIPPARPLGLGQLVRPLLAIARQDLATYAQDQGLSWIEDPSNQDQGLARNYLRHHILPKLKHRWPQLSTNWARTAAHMTEAQILLDELAQQDLSALEAETTPLTWLSVPSLPLSGIRVLSEARQRNLLRYWLARFTLLPDTAHWRSWVTLRDAVSEASMPCWALAQGQLVRAEGRIWWLSGAWLSLPESLDQPLNLQNPSLTLPANGYLHWQGLATDASWRIRYRQGGERLLVAGRGQRDLKRMLNELGVPIFLRGRLPLLFREDQLWAVANVPPLIPAGLSLIWEPPGLS